MLLDKDESRKTFDRIEKRVELVIKVVWIGLAISFAFAIVMSIGVAIAGGLGLNWLWNNL